MARPAQKGTETHKRVETLAAPLNPSSPVRDSWMPKQSQERRVDALERKVHQLTKGLETNVGGIASLTARVSSVETSVKDMSEQMPAAVSASGGRLAALIQGMASRPQ